MLALVVSSGDVFLYFSENVDIVSLTIDNFDSIVNSEDSGIWFVRFFAPVFDLFLFHLVVSSL